MNEWRESILQHNALMSAAYNLIFTANLHCSNTQSERLEAELEKYGVCPDTGNMVKQQIAEEVITMAVKKTKKPAKKATKKVVKLTKKKKK